MAYLGADGSITGYNLFVYCANNPIMHQDSSGNTMMQAGDMLSTLLVEFGRALEDLKGALGVCVALPWFDGPIPVLDIVAGGLALVVVGVAGGYAISNVLQSKSASDEALSKPANKNKNKQKQGKNYVRAKNNPQANDWAREVGYDNAEDLKSDWVGENEESKFDIYRNKDTNEIILKGKQNGREIPTGLVLP